MTNPDDPAFEPLIWKQLPLTKREWFAGQAMQGVAIWDALMHEHTPENAGKIKNVVKGCVELADALIAELNREKE